MKTIVALLISLVVVAPLPAQEESAQELLRDGLFEEEANGNIEKAEEAYRKLVERYDEERRYAGTALFRLAELARKRGAQDEAVALYRRVTGEFGGEEIAQRAGERLGEMGVEAPVQAVAGGISAEEQAELERLAELERNSPDRLDGIDEEGVYPIHRAAERGWVKAMEFLLEREVGVDVRTAEPELTPLHLAVLYGHLAVVDELLRAGANPGETVEIGVDNLPVPTPGVAGEPHGNYSPVSLAVLYERREILEKLMDANAPTEAGYVDVAYDQLIALGRNGLHSSGIYCSSLMLAIYLKDQRSFRLLIESGAEVNFRLTEEGAEGNHPNAGHASTALTMAVRFAPAFVPELLGAGAEVPQEHYHEKTILHWAVQGGNPEVVKLIAPRMETLEAGEMRRREESDLTALVTAVSLAGQRDAPAERTEVVRILLAHGAEASARALRNAAWEGSVVLVKLLLEAGAPVSGEDDSVTALHVAASREVAELLIEAGADLNAQTSEGWTPLMRLMTREDAEEWRELADFYLDQGADVSRLVKAVQRGGEETIESITQGIATKVAMETYVLERAVYPKLPEGKVIKVIVPGIWKLEVGDREWIEGTAPPTIPEFLMTAGIGYEGAWGEREDGVVRPPQLSPYTDELLLGIRVFRQGEEGLKVAAEVRGEDLRLDRLPELRWGDLVELGYRNERVKVEHFLRTDDCRELLEPRVVTVKIGPWEEVIGFGGEENGDPNNSVTGIRLQDHFDDESGVLDLSRVTLKRGDAEPVVFDFRKGNEHVPIRLVDGDVVEVPLLPEVARLVGGGGGEQEVAGPAGKWKGVVIYFPDRPAEEEHYGTNDFIDLLWVARSFPGGRDLSRITFYQGGEVPDGGERARTIDLGALARKFPRYAWSKEKLEELNFTMGDGSLIVVPPRAEVSWRKRIRHGGVEDEVVDELINFVAANRVRPSFLGPGVPTAPVPSTPNRSVRERRVPTPPSR